MMSAAVLLGLVVLGLPPVREGLIAQPAEPPLVGRPTSFSGAIGACRLRMSAELVDIREGEPICLTITVEGAENPGQVRRPDLRQQPRFASHFAIDSWPEEEGKSHSTRVFRYSLRPLRSVVTEIPRLTLVYFRRGFVPAHLGYQTALAPAIPIRVQPSLMVQPQDLEPSRGRSNLDEIQLPPNAEVHLAARQEPTFANRSRLATSLLIPLAVFLVGITTSALQKGRRRGKSLQVGLAALNKMVRARSHVHSRDVESVIHGFVCQRFRVPAQMAHPRQIEARLRSTGVDPALAAETSALLLVCQADRFAPAGPDQGTDICERTARLLRALEEQAC